MNKREKTCPFDSHPLNKTDHRVFFCFSLMVNEQDHNVRPALGTNLEANCLGG